MHTFSILELFTELAFGPARPVGGYQAHNIVFTFTCMPGLSGSASQSGGPFFIAFGLSSLKVGRVPDSAPYWGATPPAVPRMGGGRRGPEDLRS